MFVVQDCESVKEEARTGIEVFADIIETVDLLKEKEELGCRGLKIPRIYDHKCPRCLCCSRIICHPPHCPVCQWDSVLDECA